MSAANLVLLASAPRAGIRPGSKGSVLFVQRHGGSVINPSRYAQANGGNRREARTGLQGPDHFGPLTGGSSGSVAPLRMPSNSLRKVNKLRKSGRAVGEAIAGVAR